MKLLFICTHNRCRSILSEAVTNFYGQDVLTARSAGSQPVGEVHPLSLKYLQARGIPTEGLCSQSWDEHESWQPDVVITVCDSAAKETCPVWFGQSIHIHWSLVDPSALNGDETEVAAAFNTTINMLKHRIEKLLQLTASTTSHAELARLFNQVAKA